MADPTLAARDVLFRSCSTLIARLDAARARLGLTRTALMRLALVTWLDAFEALDAARNGSPVESDKK
jgi:hypothetical protein